MGSTHKLVNSSPAPQPPAHRERLLSTTRGSSCSHLIREQFCRELISFPAWHKALITSAYLAHNKTLLQTLNLCMCQAHLSADSAKAPLFAKAPVPAINAPKIHQWLQEHRQEFYSDLCNLRNFTSKRLYQVPEELQKCKTWWTALAYCVQNSAGEQQQVQPKGYSGDQGNYEIPKALE